MAAANDANDWSAGHPADSPQRRASGNQLVIGGSALRVKVRTEHMTAADEAGGGKQHAPLPRVLLVEDNVELGEELVATLANYGIECAWAVNWPQVMAMLSDDAFDVLILDQWLGRVDTLSRLGEIRVMTAAWIVVLTANRVEIDRIVALEIGADDFLLKPVSGRELVARIRARLRRQETPRTTRPAERPSRSWRVMQMERCVYGPDGHQVPLTSTEFALLQALMETPGVPVGRETLSRRVLKRDYRTEDRALDNLVHNIRQKIPTSTGQVPVISSVRNQGYAFTGFPDEEVMEPPQDEHG